MKVKVLVIADRATRLLLVRSLQASFQVCSAARDSIKEAIEREQPDILLTEHADLCADIRQQKPPLPIIAVLDPTQRQNISQIIDEGADDCVVQPFGFAELQARIRAHIRRSRPRFMQNETDPDLFSKDGYIRMLVSQHQVLVGGLPITLTRIEFALLREFMTYAEKVLPYRLLLQHVWGDEYGEEHDYIRIYVKKLRDKIEPNPSKPVYLLTEARVGYVFRSPSVVASDDT